MSQMHQTPPTSSFGWAVIVAGSTTTLLDTEVGELGLVDVVLVVERDGDLVDDLVAPALADRGLHQLGLVPVDVVVGQDRAHSCRCPHGSLPRRQRRRTGPGGTPVRRTGTMALPLTRLDQVLAHDDACK